MEDEKTKLTKKRRQTRIEAAIASTNHALPMALKLQARRTVHNRPAWQ